jgi:hypothetical protein
VILEAQKILVERIDKLTEDGGIINELDRRIKEK